MSFLQYLLQDRLQFFQEPATELPAVGAVLDFDNELIESFSESDLDATMIWEGDAVSPFVMDEFAVEPDLGRIIVADPEQGRGFLRHIDLSPGIGKDVMVPAEIIYRTLGPGAMYVQNAGVGLVCFPRVFFAAYLNSGLESLQ